MKSMKHILCVISVLAILISASGLVMGEEVYVLTADEEFYGTWVNQEYKGKSSSRFWVKLVYKSDGTYECYGFDYMTTPGTAGFYTIVEKWTDSEGNVWYKVAWKSHSGRQKKLLGKISNSGNTYEYVSSRHGGDFPDKIDPNAERYRIYYRK